MFAECSDAVGIVSKYRALDRNELLRAMPRDLLDDMAPYLVRVRFQTNQIVSEAAKPNDLMFLESGAISNVRAYQDRSIETHMIGAEGYVSGLASTPPSSEQVARTDVVGWRISTTRFSQLATSYPEAHNVLLAYNAAVQADIAENLWWTANGSAIQRLARWFANLQKRTGQPKFYVTQETLGRLLGMRRSTVVVAASMLASIGALAYSRGNVEIKNRALLENLMSV